MSAPPRPLLLSPDNVTPPTRTPWGGTWIARHKQRFGLPAGATIGESWEVSVEPSFPSRARDDGRLLAEHIAAAPAAWLGEAGAGRCGGRLPLLLKLLDAGDDLSLQVHPPADDPRLGPEESGKPEAWIIVAAEPGAGLYLGWRDGVARAEVQRCLELGGPLDRLLNFVPVAQGEAYDVPAGTPHAIGKGVTVVEPQYVAPGRRGVTYRFWDWNRRYDAAGRSDPTGLPRDLHVARALEATDWQAPTGDALVALCRRAPLAPEDPAAGRDDRSTLRLRGLVQNPWFGAAELQGSGDIELAADGFRALLVLGGRVDLSGDTGDLRLNAGDSAAVPAAAGALRLRGQAVRAILAWPWDGG